VRTLGQLNAVKTSATDAWDEQTYSAESYTGAAYARVTGPAQPSEVMFGLNTDPSVLSWQSIDYAVNLQGNGSVTVYESSVSIGTFTTWVTGDVFSIRYDGAKVYYAKNGVVFHTSTAPANLVLFFDSMFYGGSGGATYGIARLNNIGFGPNEALRPVTLTSSAGVSVTGFQQRAVVSAARVSSHLKVEITDSDGNWRDVSAALNGPDALNRASLDELLDGNSQQFSLSLLRNAAAFQLLNNPEFINGSLAGYSAYDNGASGSITLTTEQSATRYNRSGYRLKVAHSTAGAPTPGIGGVNFSFGPDSLTPDPTTYKRNLYHIGSTLLFKVIADIPVGFSIDWTSNAIGTGTTLTWLTTTAGQGVPFEYILKVVLGTTGTFSTMGFWFLSSTGGTRPVNWYIYSNRVIDEGAPYSLSPLITNSPANRDAANVYAPIIDLHRKWRVWLAPIPADVDPLPGDYEEMGNGFIDRIEIDDESPTINLTGRDSGAVLLDAYIRTKRSYGSAGGTPIATVLQSMINDNATDNGYSGITLTVDASAITFSMNLFTQDVGGLMQALNTVAGKAGMVVRYRYNASDQLVLTLYSPNRSATVEDWSIGADEYLNIPLNSLDIDGVRNLVVFRYFDTASGAIATVQSPASGTSASITRYGLRPMFIDASPDSGINTATKAQLKADAVRLDLETPSLEQQIVSYNLWFAQLGDYVRLLANGVHYDQDQFGGVISIHHEFALGSLKSTVGFKGKPAGRYRTWLDEGKADAGPVVDTGPIPPPTARITQSAITPPTLTVETLTLDGWSNRGAAGDLLLSTRWRIIDSRTGLGTWSAWVANASPNAIPLEAAVTRGLKWKKTFEWQVRDELGQVSTASYDINSKMDALNDNGVVDDQQAASSGALLFRRTVDNTSQIVSQTTRGFIDQGGVDVSLRPISIYRGGTYEAATNLFKRGTDLASDVVITSTRTFVDPNAATQVDSSGRIVGVYRLGVYEPVNNLVKVGDTISGSVPDSSLSSNIPRLNASSINFASAYLAVGAYAGAAKSVGDIVARRSSTTGVLYFGDSANDYLYFDGATYNFGTNTARYVVAVGGFYHPSHFDSTGNLLIGAWGVSGALLGSTSITATTYMRLVERLYVDQNYGSGMVGLYDPTKYQLIYAMGAAYVPSLNGSSASTLYGIAWIYDYPGYVNLSGHSLRHGFAIFENGVVKSVLAADGFWLSGDAYIDGKLWQKGEGTVTRRVASIIISSSAPTSGDSAPDGTLWLQT
jgi:hypothetical protein